MFSDVSDVFDGLDDEDHGDEQREVLLRESGDEADVGAGVEGDEDEEEDADPNSDAKSERKVVPFPTPWNWLKSNKNFKFRNFDKWEFIADF